MTTPAKKPLAKKLLEWSGALTAVLYSTLVAFNIGAEVLGFMMLLASAILLGVWAHLCAHRAIFLLQFFYAIAAVVGILRWW